MYILSKFQENWRDRQFRILIMSIAILLSLSFGLTLLYQISTIGICRTKAIYQLLGSIIFWLLMGQGILRVIETLAPKKWQIVLAGFFVLIINQFFIRFFISLSMGLTYDCISDSDSWVYHVLSNNIAVNLACYAGFVTYSYNKNTGSTKTRPVVYEQAQKTESPDFLNDCTISQDYSFIKKGLIFFKDGSNQIFLPQNEIVYLEVDKNCLFIYTEQKKYIIYQTLKSFSLQLDDSIFIRVHRSTIVNRNHIEQIKNLESGDGLIRLRNKKEVKVSRTYKKDILKTFPRFVHQNPHFV